MTRLKATRKKFKMKLREVGERIGLTPAAVYMAETSGIQTRRTAQKYAAAFPGVAWQMLLDDYIGDFDNRIQNNQHQTKGATK
jgi:transcriptional regulator with XRE-family HTH domain